MFSKNSGTKLPPMKAKSKFSWFTSTPSSVGVRFCSPMLISHLDFGILPRLLLSIRSFRAKADFLVVSILEIGAECPNHPWMDSSPLYRKSSLLLNLESEVKLFAWKQGGSPDRPWVLHFFIYAIVTFLYMQSSLLLYLGSQVKFVTSSSSRRSFSPSHEISGSL